MMGWVAGAYGMTSNINQAQSFLPEYVHYPVNSPVPVWLMLSVDNTGWTWLITSGNNEGQSSGDMCIVGEFGDFKIIAGPTSKVLFHVAFGGSGQTIINCNLATNGRQLAVASKTTAYTLGLEDEFINADASSAAFALTLPAATGSGQKYMIEKTDSSTNAVTITPNGTDTIEGATTKSLAAQYDKIGLIDIASGLWADMGTGGGI